MRISRKGEKPPPRIVYRYGEEDDMIREFLDFRDLIKGIVRKSDLNG